MQAPDDAGEPTRVGSVELADGDTAQARREKYARIVLDQMYQFVGLLDAQGRILEINQTALAGAGLTLDDVRGLPFWEARWWAVSAETRSAQKHHVERAAGGEFVRCDMEIYGSASGHETIVVDFSLLPVRDASGGVVFLIAEGRNITEKTQAQAELARKNQELEMLLERVRRLDQLKTEFFANLSHDLRTPLTLIVGCSEALLEPQHPWGSNVTLQRQVSSIHRNALAQLRIVNDLLDVAKSDAGELQIRYRRADMAMIVRRCAALFDGTAAARSISFVVDVPPLLEGDVDVAKIERVVQNLLSNAFKFSPEGGHVRCTLSQMGAQRLLLTVQDSGPGVPPDERQVIFARFGQGRASTGDSTGTGLGLAIVKEFVDLHAGTVSVINAPGGGAQFQVELPRNAPPGAYVARADSMPISAAAEEPPAPAVPQAAPIREPQHDATVLVVDDNIEVRDFVAEVLGADYRVLTAASVPDALEQARAHPPDLLVTDLMMPDGGGEALVQALRADPPLAETPVIVVSARDDDRLRTALLSEMVQDYVAKPFSPHELRARVRNLVVFKRARDALQGALASRSRNLEQLTNDLIAHRHALQRNVETLQRSEQRWRALFEHSPAGVAVVDRAARFVVVNRAFATLVRDHPQARRGRRLADLMDEDVWADFELRLAEMDTGCEALRIGVRPFRRGDGSTAWADAAMATLPVAGAQGPFVALVAIDITDRRSAERSLQHLRERLAKVGRASTLGLLTGSIAHELNQPLTAILANAQACARWLGADPPVIVEATAACRRIATDARRAGDVIERTRSAIRDDDCAVASVDVDLLLDDVLAIARDMADDAGVLLRRTGDTGLPCVRADRVRIQQVLLNLLVNAFDASRDLPVSRRTVEVWAGLHEAGFVSIAVRDRGRGIDADVRAYVFEPFHTDKPQGMGIGLALSRTFVERLGGRIWAEAGEVEGETFRFTLPVEVAKEERPHERAVAR
jgi:PAS domain S-box-containing protein